MINGNQFPPKDPSEKLDYQFDWAAERNNNGMTNWLQDDETILDFTVTVPDGLVLESSELINDDTTVLVWISGGTSEQMYPIKCEIVTATRTGVRTAVLLVKNQ